MPRPFRLTLIHPCIGRRVDQKFIRLWQMEPLPPAVIAALTPSDVEIRFYDDRMEQIPYDEATDLVAISVETYTAKRAYQIATEFRKRKIPVVMGGFHASLCTEEVARHAESVVVGEAENVWAQVVDDYRSGQPQKFYRSTGRPTLERSTPDRRIFVGKNYLPVGLIESGRGCHLKCEFCAIQTVYQRSRTPRPVDQVLAETRLVREKSKLIFFVDDNLISNPAEAKNFLRALIPLGIRWVSQATISVAYDEELLSLMKQSGCTGILVGFESLNAPTLQAMGKPINVREGGHYTEALRNLHRYGIRIYGSFVFGYDDDTLDTFDRTVDYAVENGFFLTGFAHLTPYPGTPLYQRLEQEGRLLYDRWWMDDRYGYSLLPFKPARLSAEDIHQGVLRARRNFYSWANIGRRALHPVNRQDLSMWFWFLMLNVAHRKDHPQRDGYPLGDRAFQGALLEAR